MEKPRDFGSLRAMFQNDSNFSNMLLESVKKPSAKFSPRQNAGGSSVSCHTPKPLHQRQVPDPEQQTKQFSYTSQKLEIRQVKPMVFPKVKIKDRKESNLSLAICKPSSSGEESPKPHPRYCLSPQGLNNLNSLSKASNGRCPDDEDAKVPKIKLLPSIKELGPPPKKPPRPPKVDLGAFQQNFPDAADDAYLTPEITEMEDLNTYEETIYYQEQQENCPNSTQQPIHSFKSVKKEDTKICSPQSIFMKPRIRGNEKNMPQEETNQSFSGGELAKDGDFSDDYVCLESLRTDEEKWNPDLRTAKLEQAAEEVYDDVEGIERGLQSSDAHRSFALDSNDTYEETYEDIQSEIQSEGYNSSKSEISGKGIIHSRNYKRDIKVEKLKGFGKFFKEKLKIKTAHMKGSSRNLSRSVPNLDVMAQENFIYNDIDPEQNDTKNPLKVKKYIVEKNNKMTKEEQSFRERFMYNKEITVINTAVAHCSNTPIGGNLDLRILPGEQLEVIDITEGNQLICRNSEGKYGYVLLEHLNFRH
ncbi:hypothetical protein NXF25_009032 [Crotalus adamanteus]|uniref:FYN-binding protein 2 n=1 Tax=Crotalus adamanteus TaxID=8729 RepID=A0AAW1BQU5_CROAD